MKWDGKIINDVKDVINNGDTIIFILQTKDENDYWWLEISRIDWDNYWKKENDSDVNIVATPSRNNKTKAIQFVNDPDNTNLGFSCGGYPTVSDAINGYKEELL